MKTLIILIFGFVLTVNAQRVYLRMCWNLQECPTNYPIQVQDAKADTSIPPGFTSNWTWVAYYQALPTFDTIWTNWQATNVSSGVFSTRTNIIGLQLRQVLLLSNINWFSTNMSVLNATLASSNLVMLRAIEERLKNP